MPTHSGTGQATSREPSPQESCLPLYSCQILSLTVSRILILDHDYTRLVKSCQGRQASSSALSPNQFYLSSALTDGILPAMTEPTPIRHGRTCADIAGYQSASSLEMNDDQET